MRYKIVINSKTEKMLSKIEKSIAVRIRDKIRLLSEHPRPSGMTQLKGYDNAFRIRVGDYRIIYEIDDDRVLILVVNVGHRREVYR